MAHADGFTGKKILAGCHYDLLDSNGFHARKRDENARTHTAWESRILPTERLFTQGSSCHSKPFLTGFARQQPNRAKINGSASRKVSSTPLAAGHAARTEMSDLLLKRGLAS
jgi:hypothetical protein